MEAGVNPRNVWPAVVVALGAMAICGAMAIAGVDRDTVMWAGTAFVPAVLAALLVGPLAENRAATQAVQQQTNGNTSTLVDLVRELTHIIAASQPPTKLAAEATTSLTPTASIPTVEPSTAPSSPGPASSP